MPDLLLYGGGGQGKVVLDIVQEAGRDRIIGILDDDPQRRGEEFQGYPILGGAEVLADPRHRQALVLVALGDNRQREAVARRVAALERRFGQAIHPAAHLAKSVRVGPGTVIMAGVVINPDVVIAEHVVVNTASSIDHDCTVGSFVHISPGVRLAGGVVVGHGAHIGIGASVLTGVRIGRGAVVGAGAVVIEDVGDDATVMGVPAKPRENRGQS